MGARPLEFVDLSPVCPPGEDPSAPNPWGKFIVVRALERQVVIISPRKQSYYHAHILERWARGEGLAVEFNARRDSARVLASGIAVLGGGFWLIERAHDRLWLWGKSQAYGPFDAVSLRRDGVQCPYEIELAQPPDAVRR